MRRQGIYSGHIAAGMSRRVNSVIEINRNRDADRGPAEVGDDGIIVRDAEVSQMEAVFYESSRFYVKLRKLGAITVNDVMLLLPFDDESDFYEDHINILDTFKLLEFDGNQRYVGRTYKVREAPIMNPYNYYRVLARDTTGFTKRPDRAA